MNKILTFITGLLCGAIITTLGFMIYIKSVDDDMMKPDENGIPYKTQQDGEIGNPPEMPNGEKPIRPDYNR